MAVGTLLRGLVADERQLWWFMTRTRFFAALCLFSVILALVQLITISGTPKRFAQGAGPEGGGSTVVVELLLAVVATWLVVSIVSGLYAVAVILRYSQHLRLAAAWELFALLGYGVTLATGPTGGAPSVRAVTERFLATWRRRPRGARLALGFAVVLGLLAGIFPSLIVWAYPTPTAPDESGLALALGELVLSNLANEERGTPELAGPPIVRICLATPYAELKGESPQRQVQLFSYFRGVRGSGPFLGLFLDRLLVSAVRANYCQGPGGTLTYRSDVLGLNIEERFKAWANSPTGDGVDPAYPRRLLFSETCDQTSDDQAERVLRVVGVSPALVTSITLNPGIVRAQGFFLATEWIKPGRPVV
ncbi:MAG: hypothetical protein ACP5NF_11880, partial [Thermoanaerobaculum sp.]